MKSNLFRLVAFFAAFMALTASFTSCKDDEDSAEPATMVTLTVTDDNAEATVVFSEGVYRNADKTGNLDAAAFNVTITGGVATLASYSVEHTAGATSAKIMLVLGGAPNGQEVLTVTPASATSIYNAAGAATVVGESKTATLKETGIIGKWYSSGLNVAPLLLSLGIDSIYADFKTDGSYVVESFSDGAKTTLTGNFTQTKSGTGNIWNITVNQNQPTALTSQGIFEVMAGNPLSMKYEIAQTDPAIAGVTPPTAAGGFGSTSSGAFGVLNVQTYLKLQ